MARDLSNQKNKFSGVNLRLNLITIGILVFTFYFITFRSFFISSTIGILILLFSIITLIFANILLNKTGINLTRVDVMWLLFLVFFIISITFHDLLTPSSLIDIFVYSSGILYLLLVKVNISNYYYSFKIIKLFAIVYALSAIFQYLFTDLYLRLILPFFSAVEQERVLRLLSNNSYAGFTDQTAYIAAYIVYGIGIIVFSNWKNNKLFKKTLSIMLLIILFVGLLLTAKRAHLFFMILAIFITVLLSIESKKFVKAVLKVVIGIFIICLLTFFLLTNIDYSEDSPIAEFVGEIEETIVGVLEGEDVTSGRTILYSNSWELFTKNPIFGIGWSEFMNSHSLGLINSNVGSHPHNIYLQLLTELGLIGFLLFMFPLLYVYYKTYRILRKFSAIETKDQKWKFGIQFSFFLQTFFILYGIVENAITDYNFLLMYFFACSICLSAGVKLKYEYENSQN